MLNTFWNTHTLVTYKLAISAFSSDCYKIELFLCHCLSTFTPFRCQQLQKRWSPILNTTEKVEDDLKSRENTESWRTRRERYKADKKTKTNEEESERERKKHPSKHELNPKSENVFQMWENFHRYCHVFAAVNTFRSLTTLFVNTKEQVLREGMRMSEKKNYTYIYISFNKTAHAWNEFITALAIIP